MGKLDGKVAIITGGGSGIGAASARLFAREGASVVIADLALEKGEEIAAEITKNGGRAICVHVNVTRVADMERMIRETVRAYGRLDVLFNNVGAPGAFFLEGVDEEQYQRCLDLNVKGGWFATKFAVPEMRKAGGGAILFTASTAGIHGVGAAPLYSMAKGAVIQMCRSFALLLAKDNIRVNAVCPSITDTPLAPAFVSVPGHNPQELLKKAAEKSAIKRMAKPEEIANAALFLVSDEASFVTGVAFPVDGGNTA